MGGDGYPTEGVYSGLLTKNRNVTFVDGRNEGKHKYVRRSFFGKNKEFQEMNMTQWQDVNTKKDKPNHFCLTVLADLEENKQLANYERRFRT